MLARFFGILGGGVLGSLAWLLAKSGLKISGPLWPGALVGAIAGTLWPRPFSVALEYLVDWISSMLGGKFHK